MAETIEPTSSPTGCFDLLCGELDPCARPAPSLATHKQIMGGHFCFRSRSKALLDLVEAAYGGHAPHRFPGDGPDFDIELRLLPRQMPVDGEPPAVRTRLGTDRLYGIMDDCNYVLMSPQERRALVVASEDMLAHPYHLRYELIEFAVFILAARGQGLVPLHAACVGRDGRGVLLFGASGAGKSTLALHGLLLGLELLAEDAAFVQPDSMLATGVANYLHVQADALDAIGDPAARRWIAASPVIRRRSGVEKFEADLRWAPAPVQLAREPMQVAGAVIVSNQRADDPAALLTPVVRDDIATCLFESQAYAREQPGWQQFEHRMRDMPVYQLRRAHDPGVSAAALQRLLG